jgi:hypothetical protein
MMTAKQPINRVIIEPVNNPIDRSDATAELLPDEIEWQTSKPFITGATVIEVEQLERIGRLEEQAARDKAKIARYEDSLAERFEVPKNAETDTGIPRQTLKRWAAANPPLIKHKYDDNGQLWIDVIDAKRQRFFLAPRDDGHK